MASTISSNMSLIIPTVGQEPGPQFAFDLNNSLTLLDRHNHVPGSGVPIPPAGLNINSNLSFQSNFATGLAGLTLVGQAGTPANNTVYNSNNSSGDLYYVNNNGLAIQITNASGIVGSPGTISGISGTASASYSAPTFFWRSATSTAANMDFGSAIMRNLSPNSTFALTLSPPAALGANYTLVLPPNTATPSFLSVDGSGNIINYAPVSGGLTSSNLSASAGITGSQLSASANIAGTQLSASANIAGSQIVTNPNFVGTVESGGRNLVQSGFNAAGALQVYTGTINVGTAAVTGAGLSFNGSGTNQISVAFANTFLTDPQVFVMPTDAASFADPVFVYAVSGSLFGIQGTNFAGGGIYNVFIVGVRA